MKEKNDFKEAIKAYLDQRAKDDALFKETYKKENKNIDDCCNYIIGQAKKQATKDCAVISDDVVFSWAVHYYDEDDIKIDQNSSIKSEVITFKPKTNDNKPSPKEKKKESANQLSLF